MRVIRRVLASVSCMVREGVRGSRFGYFGLEGVSGGHERGCGTPFLCRAKSFDCDFGLRVSIAGFGYPWKSINKCIDLGVLPRLFVFLGTVATMHIYRLCGGCGIAGNLHYVKGVAMFCCREDCSVESDELNHKVDFFSRPQEGIS